MTLSLISHEESNLFARLSGDFNCQHIDPVRARRLPFGRTVVHGLHTVLLSLDRLAEGRKSPFVLSKIRTSFSAPVFQTKPFSIEINDRGSKVGIQVSNAQGVACTISLELDDVAAEHTTVAAQHAYAFADAVELNAEDLVDATGEINLTTDATLVATLLPHAAACLPPDQIAVALASTRLVGMRCTGERSIFKFLSLNFNSVVQEPILAYKVERFEAKSGLASISLSGSGVSGTIHAVLRARPVPQESFAAIRARVPQSAFADQSVLVIGGTRGLGEIAAKAAAAGGAKVAITYALGAEDAERVAAEIVSNGGLATSFKLDVLSDTIDLSSLGAESVSRIYYFPSPKITFNEKTNIDLDLLNKYISYYVTGLHKIISNLADLKLINDEDFAVFAPSTVFIDAIKPGAFEYAAAKSIAETYGLYCAQKFSRNIRFLVPRLPMLRTDQTSTVDADLPGASEVVIAELLGLG